MKEEYRKSIARELGRAGGKKSFEKRAERRGLTVEEFKKVFGKEMKEARNKPLIDKMINKAV